MTNKQLVERSVRLGLAHKANPTPENEKVAQAATLEVIFNQINIGGKDETILRKN